MFASLGALALLSCTVRPRPGTPAGGQLDVENALHSLSLEEKVGQLFVVSGRGIFMNEESEAFRTLKHHVVDNHVGGVIWFRSNVYETAVLTARLQGLAEVPLLVAADLEAGSGMRFDDVTYGPWAMAIGATGDPSLAERRAFATAQEARALGITQIYAPVADVNVNPDNPVINVRSYGEDPREVARFVAAAVHGFQAGNVLSTLKHFPGHGDTSTDTHRVLSVIPVDAARLDSVELVPFRAGIEAGAGAVMLAHLAVPALDPTPMPPPLDLASANKEVPGRFAEVAPGEFEKGATLPATLSYALATDLLRKKLGFRGLVVTDSMQMGGIVAYFEAGEAAVRSIAAGADQVLMSADTDAAIPAVIAAVRDGRLPEARIDESVRRVLVAKRRLGLFARRSPPLDRIAQDVGKREHEEIEAEIAARSLTLVREAGGVLPLTAKKLAVVVIADEATLLGPVGPMLTDLAKRAKAGGPQIVTSAPGRPRAAQSERTSTLLDPRSTESDVAAVVDVASGADAILLAFTVRARSGAGRIAVPEAGRSVVPKLLALGKPVVAVSFGSPYLLREFPELPTYVCAYGIQDVVQVAALRALFGEASFEGKLPVTIPGIAPRGTGIQKGATRSEPRAAEPAVR